MQCLTDSPIGRLVPTIAGQQAFVPDPLPNEFSLSSSLVHLLDEASRAVGALDAIGEIVPSPNLLIAPLLRREAVLSSKIEGTVSTLADVYEFEAIGRAAHHDVLEVANYVSALEHGIELLDDLPISFRLVNQIHGKLLEGVRGEEKRPGAFRDTQVWIAGGSPRIQDARFIPPPPALLRELFQDWERFINDRNTYIPPLIKCGLMHYQLEAIHPYTDGNGRIGRLLITLFLKADQVLSTPIFYLSAYFEGDRQRYYDELLNVSVTGKWDQWLRYFLEGVIEVSLDTRARIRRLRELLDRWRRVLMRRRSTENDMALLEELSARPVITAPLVAKSLEMSYPGARRVLDRLVDDRIVRRMPDTWPTLYVADELLDVLIEPIARAN